MKKFLKFIFAFVMVLSLIVPVSVFAQEGQYVDEKDIVVVAPDELANPTLEEDTQPAYINDFRSRKVNVKTYSGWSPYKRVSHNIRTGRAGGSITVTKGVTFGTVVNGNINGLGISTNISLSSQTGYMLHVGSNRRVYVGFRVHYKIETGTRQYYDVTTGKVISSNRYTVKTPQYGEYKLISY